MKIIIKYDVDKINKQQAVLSALVNLAREWLMLHVSLDNNVL